MASWALLLVLQVEWQQQGLVGVGPGPASQLCLADHAGELGGWPDSSSSLLQQLQL
jgi:hypothetical protein